MMVDAPVAAPPRAGTPRLKSRAASSRAASSPPVSSPKAASSMASSPTASHRCASSPKSPSPPGGPALDRRADALSPRATQALIRRTLCPQSRDKGRDAQPPIHDLLPPLTSRNDVDVELYALLAIVLRDHVQSWYGNMTSDESFVAEIVHIVAHCSRALEQRLRKLDLESLLFNELPEPLEQHITAYRAAHGSGARPPLAVDAHQAYHSLWPLPFLGPVPRPGDAATAAEQRDNEAAYRQLLVQGVLAVLLPTEDLENPCLTALVGQIFSELIIGELLVGKAAQPWLIFEGICILARSVEENKKPAARAPGQPRGLVRGIQRLLYSAALLALAVLSTTWQLVEWLATASSLPRRASTTERRASDGQAPCRAAKVPVVEFAAWRCMGQLVEVEARMPWLGGALSLLQLGAVAGPGRVGGLDGILDRLLSHRIDALVSPTRLSAALRNLRGALFPNNAPGSSSLRPPSSDAELRALRRRAAAAVLGLLPSGVAGVYFAAGGPWQTDEAKAVDAIEDLLMVFGDEYCNKHLVYGALELLLVRLMPELSEKGVVELWDERLG